MARRSLRIGAAALVALAALVVPFRLTLEESWVVETRMRRFDHARRSDFADGRVEGGLALGGTESDGRLFLPNAGAGAYTSPPLDLGISASSLGAHWTRAGVGSVALLLRASEDGAAWSEWQALEGEAAEEQGDRRRVLGKLAVGLGGRFAQYRLELRADGAAGPSVHGLDLFALDSATGGHRALRPRLATARARATIKPLGIVGRAQWGADESIRFEESAAGTGAKIWPEQVARVERIVVHHTAGPNVCASPEPYCQRRSVIAINDIYHFHTVGNGWGDIGYNSLVGYDGRIYEGRHGPEPLGTTEPISQPVIGAHALGYNTGTHGISLMGNFELEPVPDLQYDALARMVGWVVRSQLAAAPLDPTAVGDFRRPDGRVRPALATIVGHRDLAEGYVTECPGEQLYRRLDQLRDHVKRIVEWPPLRVDLRARPLGGGAVAYHVLIDNLEPEVVGGLTIKGAVPPNADFVDSWAGSPTRNRGKFDGSVVTWHAPDEALDPGRERREHVFIVRPKPGVDPAAVRTVAWVEFAAPARGVAMSERVGADAPADLVVDPAVAERTAWAGDWTVSRNVPTYYGDAYQVAEAGTGAAAYTWEAPLPTAGAYEVLAWWPEARDRATDAPYTVHARDGARTVRVDQRNRGSRWVSLGTFAFEAGPARVVLSDDANGVVVADAVRFRQG
jgi:hypothetical protein